MTHEFSEFFASDLSRQEKARRIAEIIVRERGYPWIGLYDVLPDTINLIDCNGELPVYPVYPRHKGLNGRAVVNKSVVMVNDTLNDADYLTTFGKTKSELIIPVLSGKGEVIGTIDGESHSKNAFNDSDIKFLSEFAQRVTELWALQL